MAQADPEKVPRMRALAARLREDAAETHIELFRRKLEDLASELEEAVAAATPVSEAPRKDNDRGCGR